MNSDEFMFIVQEGEGLLIEFKESFDSKSLTKHIVAFANSCGGRIFLGISDDCEIKGISITNKLKSEIQDLARNCEPSLKVNLEIVSINQKKILIIFVPDGENKPYLCSSGFFLRQGATSQKLSRDEIFEFAIREGRIRFDSSINDKFNFPLDFDEKKLNEYFSLASLTNVLGVKEVLVNLGVAQIKEEKILFNNTGILFFSRDPGKFFLTSKVICVNYQGDEKTKILDRKIFDGGIIQNIQDAISYVKKHINIEFEIKKLKREEILQFPEEAIRECIINAIMHRDYYDESGDLIIEVFRHKLVVSNPGGLVRGLRSEEFGKISRTRNPLIANILGRTEYVEKLGTGISRIRTAMADFHLPLPLFEYNHSFFVTLYDKVGKITDRVTDRVTDNQTRIIEAIRQDKFITTKKLSGLLQIAQRNVKENISHLKKIGLIKRIGSEKSGHWEVVGKE